MKYGTSRLKYFHSCCVEIVGGVRLLCAVAVEDGLNHTDVKGLANIFLGHTHKVAGGTYADWS